MNFTEMIASLNIVTKASLLIFVVSSMLEMGLCLTAGQIVAPLRNVRQVLLALLANFVLMPMGAFATARLLRLDEPLGAGLLLLGTAAGAPFLPKLSEIAKGNRSYAVGLTVLLTAVSIGYMPLVLPLLLTGVSVNPAKIAGSLVLFMLLPLAIGLAVKSWREGAAVRLQPVVNRACNLSLILLLALILALNYQKMLDMFGTRAVLAAILFILLGLGIGWILGGPDRDTRCVLALGTGQRNIAAALVIGSQNFSDAKVVVMLIVVAIVGLFISIPIAYAGRKWSCHDAGENTGIGCGDK
jgi:bile acid:Na+ symporter, BASS family